MKKRFKLRTELTDRQQNDTQLLLPIISFRLL